MKLYAFFLMIVGSQNIETFVKKRRDVSQVANIKSKKKYNHVLNSLGIIQKTSMGKEEIKATTFYKVKKDSAMTCKQFDPLVVGGSWDCDSFDEFGVCKLNCSTGKFGKVFILLLIEFKNNIQYNTTYLMLTLNSKHS